MTSIGTKDELVLHVLANQVDFYEGGNSLPSERVSSLCLELANGNVNRFGRLEVEPSICEL
jgi:hypothetical protein